MNEHAPAGVLDPLTITGLPWPEDQGDDDVALVLLIISPSPTDPSIGWEWATRLGTDPVITRLVKRTGWTLEQIEEQLRAAALDRFRRYIELGPEADGWLLCSDGRHQLTMAYVDP